MAKRSKADWAAEDLVRQAEAAAALIDYLKTVSEDDDDLIADGLEGETNFLEAIDSALEQIAEAQMMAKAIKVREAELAQRRKRFEDKAAFLRNCLEMAMAQANGDASERPLPFTLKTPFATVTLREGKPKILIDDEAKLPAQFWRQPDPVVDKAALNEYVAEWIDFWNDPTGFEAVIEGDEPAFPEALPDGVTMTDAGFSLSIRRN